MKEVGFEARVVEVLDRLRPGEVVSYGEVAAEAGFPGAARAVGNLLGHGVADVPWWRVVRSDGTVVSHHSDEQIARLAAEGVTVVDGRVRPWRRAGDRNDAPAGRPYAAGTGRGVSASPGRGRAAPGRAVGRARRKATE
jgi:methylated-DNA-protein-cysteine methyltransferase related protein